MRCKVLLTFSIIDRMVSTMMPKSSAIITSQGAIMRPSAALWQSVLVM